MNDINQRLASILDLIEQGQLSANEGFEHIRTLETRDAQIDSATKMITSPKSFLSHDEQICTYTTEWIKSDAKLSGTSIVSGVFLLFAQQETMRQKLIDRIGIDNKNVSIIMVMPGDRLEMSSDSTYTIDPAQETHYYELFRTLKQKGKLPTTIIHAWSQDPFTHDENELESQLAHSVYSLLYSTKAYMEQKVVQPARLLYLYRMDEELTQPVFAASSAFIAVLQQEYPQILSTSIGVQMARQGAILASLDQFVECVCRELQLHSTPHKDVRYHGEERFVRINQQLTLNNQYVEQTVLSKENGVYLITGGCGGLGFLFAKELAKTKGVSIILTGRSPLGPMIVDKVKQIEELGATAVYVSCDLSQREEVEQLVDKIKKRFGTLHGIIHSAGITKDAYIMKKHSADFAAVLGPKVQGTLWLDQATQDEPLDFFVLFSSTASLVGNIGQSDYAYANRFMDEFVLRRIQEGKSGKTLAINWGLWAEGGMQVEAPILSLMDEEWGMKPIPTNVGLLAYQQALSAHMPQIAVMYGEEKRITQLLRPQVQGKAKLTDDKTGETFVADSSIGESTPKDNDDLRRRTKNYLFDLIAKELKLSTSQFDPEETFDRYGIDSVTVMSLISKLEQTFGSLPKTLFFEYQSIVELTDYFLFNHEKVLKNRFGPVPTKTSTLPVVEPLIDEPIETSSISNMNAKASIPQAEIFADEGIAIIGISGRYPEAESLEIFWENLKNGKDSITTVPADRWDAEKLGTSKWGGFVDDVDKFDPLFFNIAPKEAYYMDPQERLFLQTTWHTIEDAGYTASMIRKKAVGVFVGVTYGHYQYYGVEGSQAEQRIAIGGPFASIANRVSYFLNLHGPSMAIDTMCSSSITAIHLACESIRRGECEYAVAGGVNLSVHPNKYVLLEQSNFLASDGRCRSFGAAGDGYVPGEGVGAVLLKPLSKAIEDGDRIYGVIKASSINHGGKTNGYTVPNPQAQASVIAETIRKANIVPATISYIEAHGTGTALGDPIEIAGLNKAFGSITIGQTCAIGSVKSNIGHLESAAGIAALTKVLLQMQHNQLVPSIHSDVLNPNIDFDQTIFTPQQQLEEWHQPQMGGQRYPRRAGISSFGAGGSNGHIIVEEYIEQGNNGERSTSIDGAPYLILLSAKNHERLKVYAENLYSFVQLRCNKEQVNTSTTYDLDRLVEQQLLSTLAEQLGVLSRDISVDLSFDELGLEPMQLEWLIQHINLTYGLTLHVFTLTEYRSLKMLSKHMVKMYYSQVAAHHGIRTNQAYQYRLEGTEHQFLINLAYTSQTSREAMEERLALVVHDVNDLLHKLEMYLQQSKQLDDVFFGNAKKTKMDLGLILEGAAGKEFLNLVIQNSEYTKLAKLWASGADIDWNLLYLKQKPKRVAFPLYPFAKESYWIPFLQSQNKAEQPISHAAPSNDGQSELVFQKLAKVWREAPLLTSVHILRGTILVLVNEETVSLPHKLFADNPDTRLIVIKHHVGQERVEENGFDFTDAEQGKLYAYQCLEGFESYTALLDLSDLSLTTSEITSVPMGKITFLQEIVKHSKRQPISIFHVTCGLQSIDHRPSTMLGAETATLVKVLGAEYNHVHSKTIELGTWPIDTRELEHLLLNEMTAASTDAEVIYENKKRYISQMTAKTTSKLNLSNQVSWNPDLEKVIVITGGTRGLGKELCQHYVNRGARKFALLGIQPLPERDEWDRAIKSTDTPAVVREKLEWFRSLESQGVQLEIYTGSLLEEENLSRFFNRVRKKIGVIGTVFHCAGTHSHRSPAFIHKSSDEMAQVFAPKIQGLQVLHNLLSTEPLTHFVLFSSVAGLLPKLSISMADYAVANAWMDMFAQYQRNRGYTFYYSIHWPSWRGTGMGAIETPMYSQLGLSTHSVPEGIAMMENVLSSGESGTMPCLMQHKQADLSKLLLMKQNPAPGKRIVQQTQASSQLPQSRQSGSIDNGPTNATALEEIMNKLTQLFVNELVLREEHLDPDTPFADFGVDSILMVGLIKRIEEWLEQTVDPSILLEHSTIRQLSEHLQPLVSKVQAPKEKMHEKQEVSIASSTTCNTQLPPASKKIAVIGLACHFPGANDKDAFWQNLISGVDSITEVPESRFNIHKRYHPEFASGKSISKWGGFIEDIESFDPSYFQFSETDAEQIDPLIRQTLEVTVETLQDAGYTKEELWNRKVGVFFGARQGFYAQRMKQFTRNSIIGMGQNFIAAHISHFFNWKGPNLVVDTACSSSLVSIHLACQSLLSGESEIALAGGVDLILDETPYLVLSEARALSPDGKCHTFDKKANGFVPGEGCGAVLLKTLEQAIADGDQIYAVIEASAVNNDGHTMGVTTPNPEAQREVIQMALEKGNIAPESISYIETHGTGTMIGDPIELKALTNVFRRFTDERQFCAVGSVKTNIGHLLSAAGVASFIKVVLSVWQKQLPATLNCEQINPRFGFEESPFYPNTNLQFWNPKVGVRRAGISSFGFGGTNAHLIVRDWEPEESSGYQQCKYPLPKVVFQKKRYWLRNSNTVESTTVSVPVLTPSAGAGNTLLSIEEETSTTETPSQVSLLAINDET